MPGMSGFELLSVIRRRFPAIQVIAMSGAFSGDGVPPGVVADAFYEKGGSPGTLLEMVHAMAQMERSSVRHPNALAPIWISKNGHDPSGVGVRDDRLSGVSKDIPAGSWQLRSPHP